MTCILRIPGQVLVVLVLVALVTAPPAAGAAPAESRAGATVAGGDDGWASGLAAPWRGLWELILNVAGADGTEPPPPPPPPPPPEEEDGGDLKPPNPPTCPSGQSGGPCQDPTG